MSQKLNVLHVEDEAIVAGLVRDCLVPEGFAITWVRTIAEARTEFETHGDDYSVVIAVGRLGTETSLSFIRTIRERFERPRAIIGITAEDARFRREMLWASCDWVFAKQFEVVEFIDFFRRLRDDLAAAKLTS